MAQIVRCEYGTLHPGPYALEVDADGRCSHCVKLPWMVRRAGGPSPVVVITVAEGQLGFLLGRELELAFAPIREAGQRVAAKLLKLFDF